jgi:pimeloyl-ACP methyl ester carboxylesterase
MQLHRLENCSHWVQQDKPQETNRLMHDFLHSLG